MTVVLLTLAALSWSQLQVLNVDRILLCTCSYMYGRKVREGSTRASMGQSIFIRSGKYAWPFANDLNSFIERRCINLMEHGKTALGSQIKGGKGWSIWQGWLFCLVYVAIPSAVQYLQCRHFSGLDWGTCSRIAEPNMDIQFLRSSLRTAWY
jgi:hypothetical protein